MAAEGCSPRWRSEYFTHYYRWQYFYTLDDGNTYSIVPATEPLDTGTESEVEDLSKETMIYVNDVSMMNFIEYSFCFTRSNLAYLENFDIDYEVIER